MRLRMIVLLFVLVGAWLQPAPAQAQIMNIDLNNLSTSCQVVYSTGPNGTIKRTVSSSQPLFSNTANGPSICSSNAGLFARFFCVMESTLSLVVSSVFCAIRDAWMAPFGALMLLLMAVTGFGFITGIIQFSVKEISIVLFKMALVTMFVTNAGVAMEIAYKLYLGVMQGTVNIMMKGFHNVGLDALSSAAAGGETSGIVSSQAAGGKLAGLAHTASGNTTAGTANVSPFISIDSDLSNIQDALMQGKAASNIKTCSVFTFLAGLVLTLPFAAMIVFFALTSFLAFFARAAYGYIYALVMVTFLIAAMPIFVSFALFKSTTDLFEHWLKYIGSNVIQIFIVFAIMAFASMIDFTTFLKQVDSLIVEYPMRLVLFGGLIDLGTWNTCSICEPNFNFIAGGIPVLPMSGSPCVSSAPLEWGELIEQKFFFKFLLLNGVALYILTSVMENFMKMGPDIAQMLGGAKLVHTIGGLSTMGQQAITSAVHRGSDRFEKGFRSSWRRDEGGGGILRNNPISKTFRAFRGGADEAQFGEYDLRGETEYDQDQYYQQEHRGMQRTHESLAASQARSRERLDGAQSRALEYKSLWEKGEITPEQYRNAVSDYSRQYNDFTRTSSALQNAPTDVTRQKDTGIDWARVLQSEGPDKESNAMTIFKTTEGEE